ncbi:thioredoxin domain-containing protein [Schaalia sp. ZJ405]|uniref:DsbA family protein n=1 Tax=Schaalia sp. ZJ405 TaxID=2709403 RepID=UPI0013ECDB70|nr:thioredoxin domain-containing protein [Schaalia sp. ZJ405]QPK80922.1 thioredoxin domain-containing protein [Schaalia sp. ZJ405]
MTENHTPVPPASDAPVRQRSARTMTTLLLALIAVIAVAVVIAVSVLNSSTMTASESGDSAATNSAPSDGGSAPATNNAQSDNSSPDAVASSGTPAPTQTDPQLLEFIRSEAHRDPEDGQARGKVDAPVVMVIYSDFSCPYCILFAQKVAPGLEDLVTDGTLRVEWRDLAQVSPTSPLAAQAGIAAAKQGKFWEFHDALYGPADPNTHPEYTQDLLIDAAKTAGVPDIDAFTRTMNAQDTVSAVAASKQHAYSIGVTGTPFLIIGDSFISGYKELPDVRATVLDQAARAKNR